MKRMYGVFLLVFLLILSVSCHREEWVAEPEVKPVHTAILQEEVRPLYLSYTGNAGAEEIKKLSFKASGKISRVPVEKGDKIQPGQLLASLETSELELDLEASKARVDAAQAQYDKAQRGAREDDIEKAEMELKKARDAYEFSRDQYERVESLYQEGFASQMELDQAKLELDLRQTEMEQAEVIKNQVADPVREEDKQVLLSQLEQAQKDYEHKEILLEDAYLRADGEGQVLEVPSREGEVVAAGQPVLVVQNHSQIVDTGLSQRDLEHVDPGMEVQVEVDGQVLEGKVTRIAPSPDPYSHTYNTRVSLEPGTRLPLGTFARLKIILGENTGIWIPVSSVLPGDRNYVYLVKEGRAARQEVKILEFDDSQVQVEGLEPGDELVVEGMRDLEKGVPISLVGRD